MSIRADLIRELRTTRGWTHSHGDVWILALALGAPLSLIRRARPDGEVALAGVSGLTLWAATVRWEMISGAFV